MSTQQFLMNVAIILGVMALISVLELLAPLYERGTAGRGRSSANLGLMIMGLFLNWGMTSAAAVTALVFSIRGYGLMAQLRLPMLAQIALTIVVLDFFYGYVAHRTMHMIPLLWRVHKVHHSDPFVDVSTTFRTHPLESIWRYLWMVVPAMVIGFPAGGIMVYRLVSAIQGMLEHANMPLRRSFDHVLSLLWVTPNMHKVHHSTESKQTDTNYGNILAVYDRVFRTFTPGNQAFNLTYGLDNEDPAQVKSLPALLGMPFVGDKPEASQDARLKSQLS